jgi:hypothetical protein
MNQWYKIIAYLLYIKVKNCVPLELENWQTMKGMISPQQVMIESSLTSHWWDKIHVSVRVSINNLMG